MNERRVCPPVAVLLQRLAALPREAETSSAAIYVRRIGRVDKQTCLGSDIDMIVQEFESRCNFFDNRHLICNIHIGSLTNVFEDGGEDEGDWSVLRQTLLKCSVWEARLVGLGFSVVGEADLVKDALLQLGNSFQEVFAENFEADDVWTKIGDLFQLEFEAEIV